MPKNNIALVIGAAALFICSANAHAYMTLPIVKWLETLQDQTAFVVAIQSALTGWPGPFNGPPLDNTKNFWAGFKTSEFKDIRDLVNKMGKVVVPGATMECGQTDPGALPQPLPDMMEWSSFTGSHEGPCVAYCDNTIVFEDENCARNFNMTPAVVPYDKEGCSGASLLTFYWIALHGAEWQVYINCAPLEGGQGGTTPNATTPTTTPSSYAPATPSPSTPPANTPEPPADAPTTAPPADDQASSAYAPEPPADSPTTASPPTPPADDQAPSAYAPESPTDAPTTPTTPPSNAPTTSITPPADAPSSSATPNAKCVRRRRTRD